VLCAGTALADESQNGTQTAPCSTEVRLADGGAFAPYSSENSV
jgi:hypothetical protein